MLGLLIQIAVMSASQSVPPGGLGLALAGGLIERYGERGKEAEWRTSGLLRAGDWCGR